MADALHILNELRKETRDNLQVTPKVIVHSKPLKEGDFFNLVVTVCNTLPPGGGGGQRGDARFKNVMVTAEATETAPGIFDAIPVDKNGAPVPGHTMTKPLPLGDDDTLEEEECHDVVFPFEAIHACEDEEQVATVRVTAEFDIARYFASRKHKFVTYAIERK